MAGNSSNTRNDITRPFQRVFNFPLDRSTIFDTLEDAQNYAKADGSDIRKLGKTAYPGQLISVVNSGDSTVKVYKIAYRDGNTNPPYVLGAVGEGDSDGRTTADIVIDGQVIVPAGTEITSAISTVTTYLYEHNTGGETTEDIEYDGSVIISGGTPMTEALQTVVDKIGDTSSAIEYDGRTIVESGTPISEALQTIVDEIFEYGGLNHLKVNDEDVYDPSTKNAEFNILGADDDIDITFDEDAAVPTFYVEVNGISNVSYTLSGTEVDWELYIYKENTTEILEGPLPQVSFIDGTGIVYVSIPEIQGYSNIYSDGTSQYEKNENGKYEITITDSTETVVLYASEE